MANYNPESSHLYIARDVVLEKSEIFNTGHFATLRQNLNHGSPMTANIRLGILTCLQARLIGEKYPKDNIYDRLVDALGVLRLSDAERLRVGPPTLVGGPKSPGGYAMAFPLDAEGAQQVAADNQKIAKHFDILSDYPDVPYISYIKTGSNKDLADFLAKKGREQMPEEAYATVSFPVVGDTGGR